ncbi:MAG: hypothetical protein RLY86_1983 [Pseudomonadota bacterium]
MTPRPNIPRPLAVHPVSPLTRLLIAAFLALAALVTALPAAAGDRWDDDDRRHQHHRDRDWDRDRHGRDWHGRDWHDRDWHGRDWHGRDRHWDRHGRDRWDRDRHDRDRHGWDRHGWDRDRWDRRGGRKIVIAPIIIPPVVSPHPKGWDKSWDKSWDDDWEDGWEDDGWNSHGGKGRSIVLPEPPPGPTYGAVYQDRRGRFCREYQTTGMIGGRNERLYGTACLQPDGSWRFDG